MPNGRMSSDDNHDPTSRPSRSPQVPITHPAVDDLIARATSYAKGAEAENTTRSHAAPASADLRRSALLTACRAFPADPQTVALYATHLAGSKRVSTIRVRLAAIGVQSTAELASSHRVRTGW